MIEYKAMIYKANRNKSYVANCIVNNRFGFGKTEKDAIENLKNSLMEITSTKDEIKITPVHGLIA